MYRVNKMTQIFKNEDLHLSSKKIKGGLKWEIKLNAPNAVMII
jgi:hypothetical protein